MFWDSYAVADHPQLWDPATSSISAAAQAGFNIFCTGFSFFPDGRLFVVGGHISDNVGLAYTSTYSPFTNSWSNLPNMNAGRWYPTATTLASGNILVVGGMVNTSTGANLLPQVWQTASSTWRNLTSAQLYLPYYPYMFLAPNGKVFNAGPSQTTRYLSTSGSGAWTVVGNNTYGARNWGSAVMYDVGKVLIMGGIHGDFYGSGSAVVPTNSAEIIDLSASSPLWQPVAPMAYPRKHHNATLLPDGKVLVTGGSSGADATTALSTNPAYGAEMWDPATNSWTTLASNTVFRGYHSVALLLPDGRVVSAGGNFEPTAEVFSPPYLFQGAHPTISSAPTSVGYGQTFFVGTPDAASITKVTWLRLSSVTHTNNMGQRINRLSFSVASGGLNVTAPSSKNLCPPGHYMLFILNGAGVPSVAKIVQIDVPKITSFNPTSGPVDTSVVITGTNLSGATAVTFNGANATTFTVESSTQIKAKVPADATTGNIAVTTPGGTASSSLPFMPLPKITGLSPTSGPAGTSVVLTGSNLLGTTAVVFDVANATFTVNSAMQITATVPVDATTGKITVTTPAGAAASSNFKPLPTITSFSPTSGPSGITVTISGANFIETSSVKFNGKDAAFTVDSSVQISAVVPSGVTTGTIKVQTPAGTATSVGTFTVAPVITSFSPTSGRVASSVTINGRNFTGATAVSFNGTAATFVVNSSTKITAPVPVGATTGPIAVTAPGGTAASTSNFTVSP
jgi:N-acetylneuraminic acid mutarotase